MYGRVHSKCASATLAGDLIVALLLANLDKNPGQLKIAVEKALASLQAVLQATMRAAGDAAFAEVRDAKVCIVRLASVH